VSVAEIAPRGDEFERTPPHDVAAEQCVLGGMLLSKDAISDVIEVIRNRPRSVNVIATGRDAPQELIDVADTVTEMRKQKHAFDQGVPAIRGVDF